MRTLSKIFLIMAIGSIGTACLARVPRGRLIYCSYSCSGSAGLGKDYCELIADPGAEPRVNVVLKEGNRFEEPEIRAEYFADEADVARLQDWLKKNKVYKLDGYQLEEPISGGYAYRIYMEYDDGQKVNVRWYGHNVKDKAVAAYNYIEAFFAPWRDQATEESIPVVECLVETRNTATRATDACRLLCQPGFVPTVIVDLNVGNIRNAKEAHGQFNADPESVRALQQDLIKLGSSTLGDYSNDEFIEGGTLTTVRLTYASGRSQTLSWHARDVDPLVRAVFDRLDTFFTPWKAKAKEE